MLLKELFQTVELPPPAFARFSKKIENMPPLDASKLHLEALVAEQRKKLNTLVDGNGTLLLRYKGKEGAVASLQEASAGEEWQICQMQGARTRVGYRVATCLHWKTLLSNRIAEYAQHPEAKVRQITIKPPEQMADSATEPEAERITGIYQKVCQVLGLRYSEELKLFVTDVKK